MSQQKPRQLPHGWIPPSPYMLKTEFSKEYPSGRRVTLSKPKCQTIIEVEYIKGIELDANWEKWFQENKEEASAALEFED
jgi:hypothetical protein